MGLRCLSRNCNGNESSGGWIDRERKERERQTDRDRQRGREREGEREVGHVDLLSADESVRPDKACSSQRLLLKPRLTTGD